MHFAKANLYRFQYVSTGMQVKIAQTMAVTPQATHMPIAMYIGFLESFRVKMRLYCNKIESFVQSKEQW